MYFAQLNENNVVVGISDLIEHANDERLVEISDFDVSLVGKLYDASSATFVDNPAVAEVSHFISDADFFSRFSLPQLGMVYAAANDDPMIAAFIDLVKVNRGVNLTSERAKQGKAYLLSKQLFTSDELDVVFMTHS